MDFWPFDGQYLMITDPDVANQITVGSSLPKSPLVVDYLEKLLGHQNMVGLDGAGWKALRMMFNPGFASGHLMTLVPYIVDATVVFGDVLRGKARSGALFEMEEMTARLTVDVIGKVTLDVDLNSQRSEHRIVTAFRRQLGLMSVTTPAKQFRGLFALLIGPALLWYNGRKLGGYIGDALDQRYIKRSADEKSRGAGGERKKRTRYAVDLALDTYEKDYKSPESQKRSGAGIDPTFRRSAIDQFKTFIFAGHDTTSSTTAWIFYFLHRHPDIHAKVVEELDGVLGPTTSQPSAAEKIGADPYLISRLPYTTAVIKETLRIFPAASTIRYGSPSVTVTDPSDPGNRPYPTSGFHVWPIVHAIHRNEDYFPDPTSFVPERHLDNLVNPPFPDAKQHRDALRPFEKGPRNCIGQELAMMEIKVIVALTVREFDFEAVYSAREGKEGEGEMAIEGHRCYQVLKGSAKPKWGLPGVVRMR
jgi:cytochrome P450